MTDFPYIGGIEVSAIQNREFIRIETDKAQAIVVALDKSNIPFSARFGDNEMVLTYDGSYKEQVEEIIAKAQSGDYEALLRELQVYGVPDGYYTMKHCSVSCKFTEYRTAIIVCSVRLRSF